jgi:hypothetical protein
VAQVEAVEAAASAERVSTIADRYFQLGAAAGIATVVPRFEGLTFDTRRTRRSVACAAILILFR